MAYKKAKQQAITLRKKGYSYSQIKNELNVSKSTLSHWLSGMPLSKKRVDELRTSEKVIEKIRATKREKRQTRLTNVRAAVATDLRSLSEREFFIAGFFLYWAEGGKTKEYSLSFSNTDPAMIRCYLSWLKLLGVPKEKIRIRLHLYSDMDPKTEQLFWANVLNVSESQFTKPYIKPTKFSRLTYRTFGHGTCNVNVSGRDMSEYVLQGMRYLADSF